MLSGSVDDVLGLGVDEVEGNADVESEVVLELVVTELVEVVEGNRRRGGTTVSRRAYDGCHCRPAHCASWNNDDRYSC